VQITTKSNNFLNLGQLCFQSTIAGNFRSAYVFVYLDPPGLFYLRGSK